MHIHTQTHEVSSALFYKTIQSFFTQRKTSVLTLDVLNGQIMPLTVSAEISQFGETHIEDSLTQPAYTHTKTPQAFSNFFFPLLKTYHVRTYVKKPQKQT